MNRPYILLLAVASDWLFSELPNVLHPVAWFGNFIHALEQRAPRNNPRAEWLYGAMIAASGIAVATVPAFALEKIFHGRGWMGAVILAALFKITFAWSALIRAGERVRRDLDGGRIADARRALGALVSRDASQLDPPLIAAAAIESLAENASDSFVAPLFYYSLFGLPGACAYRAVNTMDAMIGYHGRYEFLGKVPAWLDDALNLIPARLTALLIVAAAWLARANPLRAFEIMRRDHARTASPNAGYPMSAMAGALNARLEKTGRYCLNDSGRAPAANDIRRAARVVTLGLGIATLLGVFVLAMRKD